MELKHTRKPWTVNETAKRGGGTKLLYVESKTVSDEGGVVVEIQPLVPEVFTEEDLANAYLIAASPDMFEYLEKMVSCIDHLIAYCNIKNLRPDGILLTDLKEAKKVLRKAKND